MRPNGRAFITVLTLLLALPLTVARAESAAVSPDEARQIASEAVAYTYPLALMDIKRRVSINFDAGERPRLL